MRIFNRGALQEVKDRRQVFLTRLPVNCLFFCGLIAIVCIGCNRSSSPPVGEASPQAQSSVPSPDPELTRKKLIGVWESEGKTKKGIRYTSNEELHRDGTFRDERIAHFPEGPRHFTVTGIWHVNGVHLFMTATNAVPAGFPLNVETTNTLVSLSETEYTIRRDDGSWRTSRKKINSN